MVRSSLCSDRMPWQLQVTQLKAEHTVYCRCSSSVCSSSLYIPTENYRPSSLVQTTRQACVVWWSEFYKSVHSSWTAELLNTDSVSSEPPTSQDVNKDTWGTEKMPWQRERDFLPEWSSRAHREVWRVRGGEIDWLVCSFSTLHSFSFFLIFFLAGYFESLICSRFIRLWLVIQPIIIMITQVLQSNKETCWSTCINNWAPHCNFWPPDYSCWLQIIQKTKTFIHGRFACVVSEENHLPQWCVQPVIK